MGSGNRLRGGFVVFGGIAISVMAAALAGVAQSGSGAKA